MTDKYRVIFERGRFFIETGKSKSFHAFYTSCRIIRNTPTFLLKRIEDFMNMGDRDAALTLWMRVCELPAQSSTRVIRKATGITIQIVLVILLVVLLIKHF